MGYVNCVAMLVMSDLMGGRAGIQELQVAKGLALPDILTYLHEMLLMIEIDPMVFSTWFSVCAPGF